MKLFGSRIGYKSLAGSISSLGLLLTLACGYVASPVEPEATTATAVGPTVESAAAASPTAEERGTTPDSLPTESASPESPSVWGYVESGPASYVIGNKVGERIPDFAITLVDGSTVTSGEILAQERPTFLFFFETW
jgi:hypothetical protein